MHGILATLAFVALSIAWLALLALRIRDNRAHKTEQAETEGQLVEMSFRAREAIQVAEQLKELIEPMRLGLEAEHRKSSGYFETIESVIRQRDVWEKLYSTQAVEHGNAQALMMDAIGYLSGRLQQAGIEVKIPPLLQEVQGLYQDGHVFPVTERLRATDKKPFEKASGTLREGFGKDSGALDEAAAQAVGQTTEIPGAETAAPGSNSKATT